jgi:CRP/FNR family transcriptional regulator
MAEAIEQRTASIVAMVGRCTPEALFKWNGRQASIAIGQLLAAAAMMRAGACPMEGISKDTYTALLRLEVHQLKALAMVAPGSRSEADVLASRPKVRKPRGALYREVKQPVGFNNPDIFDGFLLNTLSPVRQPLDMYRRAALPLPLRDSLLPLQFPFAERRTPARMITTEDLLQARFPDLEPALKDEIARRGSVLEIDAGTVLLRAGEPMRSTMLVLDGRIKIYRIDDEAHEYLMYYLEPGMACAFSFMCAATREDSQITAIAETECTVVSIPFELTMGWMKQYRSWDEFVLRTYRSRFEELLQTLDNIAFRSMDERLVFYLKRKMEGEGRELHISHQEIARDLNSAREVISRLLKKMEQRGALELSRNSIHIKDLSLVGAV